MNKFSSSLVFLFLFVSALLLASYQDVEALAPHPINTGPRTPEPPEKNGSGEEISKKSEVITVKSRFLESRFEKSNWDFEIWARLKILRNLNRRGTLPLVQVVLLFEKSRVCRIDRSTVYCTLRKFA